MSEILLFALIAHEEEERRRREEEEEEEEERERQEEERRRVIKHRKTSPVICNNEDWQINRCVKAISMQPFVEEFVKTIDKVKPEVIEEEEKKYDEKLIDTGYEYEQSKRTLEKDIEALKKLGITVDGTKYELSRLTPTDTNVAKPVQVTEVFGNIFTINNGEPIELTPYILSTDGYYEARYQQMDPEGLKQKALDNNAKIEKYQKYGRYLRFLLNTNKYRGLREKAIDLESEQTTCEYRKQQLESFKSLSKEQLSLVKEYFTHLDELTKISNKIKELFERREYLRYNSNTGIEDLTIKEVISRNEYSALVDEVYDYIDRIYKNDKQTMKDAYELVKGEYPINVDRRSLYNSIISIMRSYTRDANKQLKLK